jgi:hypothetical protein
MGGNLHPINLERRRNVGGILKAVFFGFENDPLNRWRLTTEKEKPSVRLGRKTIYSALLLAAGFLFLVPGPAPAQTEQTAAQLAPVNTTAPAIKKPDAPATSGKSEIELLNAQMAAQQGQIDQLRKLVEAQAKLIESALRTHTDARAAADQPVAAPASGPDPAATPTSPLRSSQETKTQGQQASQLRFKIGTVDITPFGFMDFTAVIRDKNVGSGVTTFAPAAPWPDWPVPGTDDSGSRPGWSPFDRKNRHAPESRNPPPW